jgi:hypothetical protein
MRGVTVRELITSLLDALAILLIAAGAGAALFSIIGWPVLAVAGVVVLLGSQLGAYLSSRGDS